MATPVAMLFSKRLILNVTFQTNRNWSFLVAITQTRNAAQEIGRDSGVGNIETAAHPRTLDRTS